MVSMLRLSSDISMEGTMYLVLLFTFPLIILVKKRYINPLVVQIIL